MPDSRLVSPFRDGRGWNLAGKFPVMGDLAVKYSLQNDKTIKILDLIKYSLKNDKTVKILA